MPKMKDHVSAVGTKVVMGLKLVSLHVIQKRDLCHILQTTYEEW